MAAASFCSGHPRCRAVRRAGYTLVEMLISVVSMAVLMVGIASAVLLTTRSVDDGRNPSARTREAAVAADGLVRDAGLALTLLEQASTALTFTVPDRDSDGQDETIRYAWSGTPGDPLTREYNTAAAVDVLEDVQEFDLSYELRTGGGDAEGAETLLISYDATENLNDFSVSSQNWIGQYFLPSLPGDAVSWKVTRVAFLARVAGFPTGSTLVQLRQATPGGAPTGTVLEQVALSEWSLGYSYGWEEAGFSNVSGLSPTEGLCLVLEHASGTYSCEVQYRVAGASMSETHLVQTTDGGSSWTTPNGQAMRFKVYGTVTTSGGPEAGGLSYLSCVRIALRAGADPSTRIDTAVEMLNAPEVTGP